MRHIEYAHPFPDVKGNWTGDDVSYGMMMRDAFAMAAITGLCANSSQDDTSNPDLAKTAYNLADCMMAAREAK